MEFFQNVWAGILTAWAWVTADVVRWASILAGIIVLIVLIIVIVVVAKKKKKAKKAKVNAVVAADETKLSVDTKVEQTEIKPAEQKVEEKVVKQTEAKPIETQLEEKKTEEVATAEVVTAKPVETRADEKVIPAKKPTVKKATVKKESKKLLGKWVVEIKQDKEYSAKLLAPNGEVMLNSEVYTSEEGARAGIGTILSGIANGNFIIYADKNGNYYYKLKSASNRLLCVGEIYTTREQCLKAVDSVKRIAGDAVIVDGVEQGSKYVDYVPEQVEGYEVKKGLAGKWKIEATESGRFSAKLYASNGQLMLATEEVSLRKSAVASIEAVKKNSLAGNFIIDKDKFGRFYFKLRNVQKTVICIGEAYESLDSCIKALESVRRFANTAVFAEA